MGKTRTPSTDAGNAAEKEEAATAADEEDAVAALGADVGDLREARGAVAATLPAWWSARARRTSPSDDKENLSSCCGGAP